MTKTSQQEVLQSPKKKQKFKDIGKCLITGEPVTQAPLHTIPISITTSTEADFLGQAACGLTSKY